MRKAVIIGVLAVVVTAGSFNILSKTSGQRLDVAADQAPGHPAGRLDSIGGQNLLLAGNAPCNPAKQVCED